MIFKNHVGTIAILCAVVAGQIFAHAHLKSANQPFNSKVDTTPPGLRLIFTETITLRFSYTTLIGPDGLMPATGQLHLLDDDTLVAPMIVVLEAGRYKIEWQALSSVGRTLVYCRRTNNSAAIEAINRASFAPRDEVQLDRNVTSDKGH